MIKFKRDEIHNVVDIDIGSGGGKQRSSGGGGD